MKRVRRYIENRTDYYMYVAVQDTHKHNLLKKKIPPTEVAEFILEYSDYSSDFNHMTRLTTGIEIGGDFFQTIFSAYEVDVGLDVFFNTYPKIVILFELEKCSFYLLAENH
ncbi:hypothetical protein ID856_12400 [Xenorhabdus sp. 18]|uniref:hypothetical protein n=1 Tax=Xenorhabdus doucetiae TaxID=351671 RepID=UPI0019BE2611|nr:hypothetical protein [Xenorhabdus sp. 18]MBD2797334.1 hypothetical protein [Xenorhabdus sp. 18]